MSSGTVLRHSPTVTPTWRWESGGCSCGARGRRRRRGGRGLGRHGRRRFSCPYRPTARALVRLPALVSGEQVADREVDRLGQGFGGCQFRFCRFPYPRGVGGQLLGGVRGDLGEDRLPLLDPFEYQGSRAGLGFGSANSLLCVVHRCAPFLVGAVPCSRHGSAGNLLTALDRKAPRGVTRERHDLSPQQLGVLGFGNQGELAMPIVDDLDVFGPDDPDGPGTSCPLNPCGSTTKES